MAWSDAAREAAKLAKEANAKGKEANTQQGMIRGYVHSDDRARATLTAASAHNQAFKKHLAASQKFEQAGDRTKAAVHADKALRHADKSEDLRHPNGTAPKTALSRDYGDGSRRFRGKAG